MDYSKPIEIGDEIFWVGYVIPNDPFQCHVYLIRNKDESILIDPGSMITFPVVLEKITSLIKLRDIKYIIMHHQDPDIVGCYSTLETLFPQGKRYIVTHWRTEMLLKHYQWKTPFYLVDKHDWKLKAGDRELEFIFTPYAHFAGAFCTYDKKSEILFSSDLFGGLTKEFKLFVDDVDEYFEAAKLFHKHYIPTNEVLNFALSQVEKKDPQMIAPQHGSIIKKEFIKPLIEKLKKLDCGLYLMDTYESDLKTLNAIDEVLKKFFQDTISGSKIEIILRNLFNNLKKVLPTIIKIEFCGISPISGKLHCFEFKNDTLKEIEKNSIDYSYTQILTQDNEQVGYIYLWTKRKLTKHQINLIRILFDKISMPISISLQKELMLKELEEENKNLHQKVLIDPLTKLHNREYLEKYLSQKIEEAKKYSVPLSVAMVDIDFFKKINDTYGHLIGDCVLKEIANLLKEHFQSDDVIRYGGEEFLIVMPFTPIKKAYEKLENFRKEVEKKNFCKEKKLNITISCGIAELSKDDTIQTLIDKADKKLYEAKKTSRNVVICYNFNPYNHT